MFSASIKSSVNLEFSAKILSFPQRKTQVTYCCLSLRIPYHIRILYETSLHFSDDDVYLDDEQAIREYVLKQNGTIYLGTAQDPQPKKWYFGQVKEFLQFWVCLACLAGRTPKEDDLLWLESLSFSYQERIVTILIMFF